MSNKLNIGLFGFGCVGSGLYKVLNKSNLLDASIRHIVVKDKEKERNLPKGVFSFDREVILDDPEINVVVELIDDAEAAYEIVTTAMKKGKHVVSANKKLIAEHLEELIELKEQCGVSFLYEAAVCGSIPIIRNLEEYYNNDSLASVAGICNGTTNYILSRLSREDKSFNEILKDAQDEGFAESDPTLDIDGFDAKYKLQLLVLHAFGLITSPDEVLNFGIRHIKQEDVQFAREKGLRVRLIASAKKLEDGIAAYVAPQFVTADNFGYDVNNEFNAVAIEGLFADKQVFTGKGAGSFPTASAVLSDVSALQFDYDYEYRKRRSEQPGLFNDYYVRIYLSSVDQYSLEKLDFAVVEEEFVSVNYSYRIGFVSFRDLTHSFYRSNPDLFISFFENGEQTKEDPDYSGISIETLVLA